MVVMSANKEVIDQADVEYCRRLTQRQREMKKIVQ